MYNNVFASGSPILQVTISSGDYKYSAATLSLANHDRMLAMVANEMVNYATETWPLNDDATDYLDTSRKAQFARQHFIDNKKKIIATLVSDVTLDLTVSEVMRWTQADLDRAYEVAIEANPKLAGKDTQPVVRPNGTIISPEESLPLA